MNKSTDYIGSLAKGLKVLECFSAENPRLSIAQVSQITGLDRASARRCLLTLHTEGYANYDGKYFTPTTRILRLGTGTLSAMPLTQIVQPWLDQLSAKIGESVSITILDHTEIVYLARSAQHRVMSIGLMPGSRLPAHCASMGRVLLAHLPFEEAQSRIEKSDLTPRTSYSRTDTNDVMEQIKLVRNQGYALIDQEVEIGLRSLAVPIYDGRDTVIAALNVGVAAVQQNPEDLKDQFLDELLRVQDGLRRQL